MIEWNEQMADISDYTNDIIPRLKGKCVRRKNEILLQINLAFLHRGWIGGPTQAALPLQRLSPTFWSENNGKISIRKEISTTIDSPWKNS